MIKQYANKGGNSNIAFYEIHDTSIDVIFSDYRFIYNYHVNDIGFDLFEALKNAAEEGSGLNSLIMRFCKKKYTKRSIN